MKSICDKYKCCCTNEFEWKTYLLDSGEGVFGKWDKLQSNVVNTNIVNGKFIGEIQCPKCNKRYFVEKDIK